MAAKGLVFIAGVRMGLVHGAGTSFVFTVGARRDLVHGTGTGFMSIIGARESLIWGGQELALNSLLEQEHAWAGSGFVFTV